MLLNLGEPARDAARIKALLDMGDTQLFPRWQVPNEEIGVADFPLMQTLHVDGILGADYLHNFKVSIDYENEVFDIEPASGT